MFQFLKRESLRLWRAFLHPAFFYLLVLGNGILVLITFGVWHFERAINPRMLNYFDCLWWGVSTITTVGYGDITPVTWEGRVLGIMLMYTGTILFVGFIGLLSTRWMKVELEHEIKPLEREVRREGHEQQRIEEILLRLEKRLEKIERNLES